METGAAFGPWVLDKKVGAGGMGEVWSATHRVLGRRIAVKILAPELTREAKFRERFVSEARVQALLFHPHIAQIQDFVEENGRFAILMEWIPGGTLADALDRPEGPLPIELTLKWAGQALEALDYAHLRGVIHRDVKPANLMLDESGNIKVTDFGLAVAIGATRMTTAGKVVGTPRYMSPEQILRPQSVDRRTDVYSMGVVLYEMLAGRAPFDADSDYLVQRLHIEAPPTPQRFKMPDGFACNKDHGYSFDGKWLACSCSSPASHASQVYLVSADGGAPRQMTRVGTNYFHGFSPDGKWLLFVGQRAASGSGRGNPAIGAAVYRVSFDGSTEEKSTGAGGYDDGAEYSPDGKWIYFSSNRLGTTTGAWDIWRMPPDGAGPNDAKAERVTHDEWEDRFPHVSPNGKRIVFLSFMHAAKGHNGEDGVELRMIPAPGRKANADKVKIQVLQQLFGGQGAIDANSWSPDSTRFAYVVYRLLPPAATPTAPAARN